MSLVSVRQYFRDRMDSLSYSEWTDGFNFVNIPSTILNRSYHLEVGTISSNAANQHVHEFSYPITLRLFLKGYRDPSAAIDDSIVEIESIYSNVLSPTNRYSISIKDVVPNSVSVIPLDASNDNSIIVQFEFDTKIVMKF